MSNVSFPTRTQLRPTTPTDIAQTGAPNGATQTPPMSSTPTAPATQMPVGQNPYTQGPMPVEPAPGPSRDLPLEVEIERNVLRGLYGGKEAMKGYIEALEFRATRRGPDSDDVRMELAVAKAAYGGKPGIEKAIADLKSLMMRAMFSREGYERVSKELRLFEGLAAMFGKLEARVVELSDRLDGGTDVPIRDKAEHRALKAFVHGFEMIDAELADIQHFLTVARLNEEGMREVQLQVFALESIAKGGPGMKEEVTDIRDFLTRALLSPDGVTIYDNRLAVLGALIGDLAPLSERLSTIG